MIVLAGSASGVVRANAPEALADELWPVLEAKIERALKRGIERRVSIVRVVIRPTPRYSPMTHVQIDPMQARRMEMATDLELMLRRVLVAFTEHDLDAIMSHFTEDCVFETRADPIAGVAASSVRRRCDAGWRHASKASEHLGQQAARDEWSKTTRAAPCAPRRAPSPSRLYWTTARPASGRPRRRSCRSGCTGSPDAAASPPPSGARSNGPA